MNTNIFANEISVKFDNNTYLYMEIFPANVSILKIKKLFFSLMPKKKAEAEWTSWEDFFSEDFGLNLISVDALKSAGFNVNLPIGIGFQFVPDKQGNNQNKESSALLIIPADDPMKVYTFFLNLLSKKNGNNNENFQNNSRARVTELEKDTLIRVDSTTAKDKPVYIYRHTDFIFISDRQESVKTQTFEKNQSLANNPDYMESRKFYKSKNLYGDMIGFFFINQKLAKTNSRFNPVFLFDAILMDNAYANEISANANYIAGVITLKDFELRIMVNFFFPLNYFQGNRSILAKTMDFKNQHFFPDKLSELPLFFFKWQSNFSSPFQTSDGSHFINDDQIRKFLLKLTREQVDEIPQNLGLLFKDNISFYIQDFPGFKDINNYFLWKGFVAFNYNPKYIDKFHDLMNNLSKTRKKNNRLPVLTTETSGKKQWEIPVPVLVKKYNRKTEKMESEEIIKNVFIIEDASQIVITHDPIYIKKKPAETSTSIYDRFFPGSMTSRRIMFVYLDLKKFISYINIRTLAVAKNYLAYLENIKYVFFLVNLENDMISEELVVKIDKGDMR